MVTDPHPPDDVLLEAWARGEAQAGVALVQRHYDTVFGFFANKVDDDQAAELTQDTFTGLVEARDRFRRHSSVRTFVFAIARWKLVEHFRRRDVQRRRFVTMDDPEEVSAEPTLGSWLEGRRQESLLVVALRSLPLDDQILLELKGYEELTVRELGEVFDTATGTVASRIRRARERLERTIRELADNPDLAEETLTGLDTYMKAIRALPQHPR
ncbi:MAG: sigma-70 family RNA polymerase sigma factor [Myxococcales bacterium]|nr:sigma-70 family RNA polymerase sigma factor [Myxococcales bacterium]